MLHEEISLIQGTAVDAEARVYLQAQTDADVEEITGQLYGPSCKFARTLAATFDIRPMEGAPASPKLSSLHVPDPCYWTPQLPFLYDMQITAARPNGESCDYETAIAFKRWAADRKNWKLEGRRHVLRGAALREATIDLLSNGREVEAALFLSNPDEASLKFASREGVPLVVDLRESKVNQSHVLSWLAWSPAVFAAVVTAEQLSDRFESSPVTLPIGLAVDPRSKADDFESFDFDFYAAELDPGECPPTWLRTLEKPVIAIRRGEDYADLVEARVACDRLQAELAPEFDLAGYFVAP